MAWGAFAYIGANLHVRFGLSLTLIGLTVACFGVGGLIYAGLVAFLVYRLGQGGLTVIGGFLITAAYIVLAFQPTWWLAPIAVDGDRARLLHVPQYAADQSHADDAGSARHRGRDLFLGALFRADRRRRGGRSCHRPARRDAAFSRHGGRASLRSRCGLRTNCNGASL